MGQSISIPAQGTTLEIGTADATPVYHPIGGCKSFNFAEAEAAETDETVLTSTAKEYSTALPDPGTLSGGMQYNRGDAGQQQMHAARTASESRPFRLTLADGSVAECDGLVKSVPFAGSVGGSLEGTYNIRITGPVTWS